MTDAIDESQRYWDAHAQRDPFWAVLSEPGKEGRKWDVRRFFQTGVNEIALVLYDLASRGVDVPRGSALDFGCGVGRLTQALAPRFERVVGVDVSSGMIDTARALNRFPERVSYVWNDAAHLRRFADETFDLIYTNLVLQHVEPALTVAYLREFVRLLRPSGILLFQLPSHPRVPADPLPGSTVTPMPEGSYRASLSLARLPAGPVQPGVALTVDVDVTNASPVAWSRRDFGAMTAGNHWLDHAGLQMIQRDDGRALLPETVPPGGSCRVPLTVTTPRAEGTYTCEVDVAHEGVRWFGDGDSSVVRFHVVVAASGLERPDPPAASLPGRQASSAGDSWPSAAPGDPRAADPGIFPIHGVHTDAVAELLSGCGAELLQRVDDHSIGPTWVSFRYLVRKGPVPPAPGLRP